MVKTRKQSQVAEPEKEPEIEEQESEEEIIEGSSEEDEEEEEESSDDDDDNEDSEIPLTSNSAFEINESDGSDDEIDENEEEERDDDGKDQEIEDDEAEITPKMPTASDVVNTVQPKTTSKNVAIVSKDEYENDSSDEEDIRNTIGNVPISWYENYPHIGYDWSGKQITKKGGKANEVDDFVRKIEDPLYWRTVDDNLTGEKVVLTDSDAELVQNIKKGKFTDPNYNPYPDFIDFFTYEKMIHPLTNEPERKASFIPSLSEKRMVSKLVAKIKRNWQKPKVEHKKDKDLLYKFNYDVWQNIPELSKRQQARQNKYIPAPKLRLPGHAMSYNPPPEYLLTDQEKDKLRAKEEDKDEEDRRTLVFPAKYPNLRSVPGYQNFIKERFERCLDLYLCPRVRKMKANVDPDDLIPKLPKPRELQPFPTVQSIMYIGHEDVICSLSVEPKGQFMASASNDGTVRIWEIMTGRCIKKFSFNDEVKYVAWNPNSTKSIVAVSCDKMVVLIEPGVGERNVRSETDEEFKKLNNQEPADASIVEWTSVAEDDEDWEKGQRMVIKHNFPVSQIAWHPKGDYFAVVLPKGGYKSVVIHQLSKKRSQVPFKKAKGVVTSVLFHPTRAYFCVATRQYIRIYNLVKQELSKKLMTGCNHISSIAIHPGGDNIIAGSFDNKLPWFDLDLSSKPYKVMRYHKKAIRSVAYHRKYPLFASASDDGSVIVSHGMVYSDLMKNPLIVPVKVLHGHQVVEAVGVTDCVFHPEEPWIFSAGADKTIRLFT